METVKIVAVALLLAIAPIPTSIGLITLSLIKLRDETFRIRREMFNVRESFDGLSLEQLEKEFVNITKRIKELNALTALEKKSMGAAFAKELFTLQEALDDVNERIEHFKSLIVEIPTDGVEGEKQNTNNIKSELDKQLEVYKRYGHLRSVQANRQAVEQAKINKEGLQLIQDNTRDSLQNHQWFK